MKTKKDTAGAQARLRSCRVLAMDPGKRDFACCYVVGGKIERLKMFNHTVHDLREQKYISLCASFAYEFDKFVKALGKVDVLVVERFTARPGKSGGAVSESINIMIGFMTAWCLLNGVEIVLVQASTWKNRMRRLRGLDTQAERYGRYVTKTGKLWPIADHEFDAVGIAQWYLETHMGSKGSTKKTDLDLHGSFKSQLDKLWNKIVAKLTPSKLKMLEKSINKATENFNKRQDTKKSGNNSKVKGDASCKTKTKTKKSKAKIKKSPTKKARKSR